MAATLPHAAHSGYTHALADSLAHICGWVSTSAAVRVLVTVCLGLAVLYLYLFPYRRSRFWGRNLPSAPADHWLFGTAPGFFTGPPGVAHQAWMDKYGKVVRYPWALGDEQVLVGDVVAIGHMLNRTDLFDKPKLSKVFLEDMFGRTILTADVEQHRRQRRVISPAFAARPIAEMLPAIWDEALELRRELATAVIGAGSDSGDGTKRGGAEVNMMAHFSRAALNIVGTCGLGHDGLGRADNDLGTAYTAFMTARMDFSPLTLFQLNFPLFRNLPTKPVCTVKASIATIKRTANQIIAKSRQACLPDQGSDSGTVLSHIHSANADPGRPAAQRLEDAEVLSLVTTLMFNGHETSATAMSWGMWRLAARPDLQARLREELATLPERPSMDELNALPLLENVVREVLRLNPPVCGTFRETLEDTVLPLGEPIRGLDGSTIHALPIPKGASVYIPYINANCSTEIWGEDAGEFNPDRFDRPGIPAARVPSLWGNLLTFATGPHNCVGYRFALAEIKAVFAVLLRDMAFELVDGVEIVPRMLMTSRPYVAGRIGEGAQMPLRVRVVG